MKRNLKSRRDRIDAKKPTIEINGETVYEEDIILIEPDEKAENQEDNENKTKESK